MPVLTTDDVAEGTVFVWTLAWNDEEMNAAGPRVRRRNPTAATHHLCMSNFDPNPKDRSAKTETGKFSGTLDPAGVNGHPNCADISQKGEAKHG